MASSDWIDKFFLTGFYAEVYNWTLEPIQAQDEVSHLIELLNLQPGAHVLDWCCGWGRHSIELAKTGFRVTGLDYTPLHLEMAEKSALEAGVNIDFIHADFRQTPPQIQADAAINMFTAGIGYLGVDQDIAALRSLFAALKPGAKILIDTGSLYWISRNYAERGWRESQDKKLRLLERRQFNFLTGNMKVTMFYQREKEEETQNEFDIKIYTPHELAQVVTSAGFSNINVYGNLKGDPCNFESRRLVLVAQKA